MFSTSGGVQYIRGYLEYTGGLMSTSGGFMSTSGGFMSTSGDVQYIEEIRYHEYIGGYHE